MAALAQAYLIVSPRLPSPLLAKPSPWKAGACHQGPSGYTANCTC